MKKKVATQLCNRCPVGKELAATQNVILALGDTRWRLQLCEDCGRRLERDMFAWGRLGESLGDANSKNSLSYLSADYLVQARHAAELRSSQERKPEKMAIFDSKVAIFEPGPVTSQLNLPHNASQWRFTEHASQLNLPHNASQWRFTEHAIERMEEREISVVEALRAASAPQITREGKLPGTALHETVGIKVVVNVKTKHILTATRTQPIKEEAIS